MVLGAVVGVVSASMGGYVSVPRDIKVDNQEFSNFNLGCDGMKYLCS